MNIRKEVEKVGKHYSKNWLKSRPKHNYEPDKKVEFFLNGNFLTLMNIQGWKRAEFAKKIGYTQQQLSAVMNRKVEPSRQMLREICTTLNCDLKHIVDTIHHNWR
jgi:DNA-binding Xre family transcriptional regulator